MNECKNKIPLSRPGWPEHDAQKQAGFSLVELIITLTVTAIIAGMAAQLLSRSVIMYGYIYERKEALHSSRMALQRITRELRQIASSDSIVYASQDSIRFFKQGGENISIAWQSKVIRLNGQPLADKIYSFKFEYYDDQKIQLQTPVSDPKKIWRIGFELITKPNNHSLKLQYEVEPRNF